MPRIRPDQVDDPDGLDDLEPQGRRPRRPAPTRRRTPPRWDATADDPALEPGVTRSTYQESRASQGPQPPPPWLITTAAAIDRERCVIKTGKEADVDLVERTDPLSGATCLLAAKRYRSGEHRLFHRDAGYLEGRRVRRSRENRAMANRTEFGRAVIASQWASAEFAVLGRLWSAGAPVPYPVQYGGTELLLEFVGDPDGTAAPRLAELRPDDDELDDLWAQCRRALGVLAELGYAHGDLSAYNLLVHHGRVVVIDLPQVVDVVGNPQGLAFLHRDCVNLCAWFTARGHPHADVGDLVDELATLARR